jgi:hypothetical protein
MGIVVLSGACRFASAKRPERRNGTRRKPVNLLLAFSTT